MPRSARSKQSRPSPVPGDSARWWRGMVAGAALLLMTIAVYGPLRDAGYIWDDDDYVTNNITLRSGDGLLRIWFELGAVPQYYPLVHSTFWIEYHLWGLHPFGFHAINVLLHATSAILLWRLLVRLQVPGAWLAGALFAVHPVMVESVAWITERKNVLSLTLALASLHCYLRFAPPQAIGMAGEPPPFLSRVSWYLTSLVLFIAALLSKTVVATTPAVLLVIFWWKRKRFLWDDSYMFMLLYLLGWIVGRYVQSQLGPLWAAVTAMALLVGVIGLYYLIRRRFTIGDCFPLLPFFAVGIALAMVTAWMEKHVVGAAGAEWNFSWADRVLIAGRAVWFYAGKLLFPYPLVFFYPKFVIDDRLWWQYLYTLAAVALLIFLWALRSRISPGPLAAALIFGGVLTPALGFVDVFPFRYSFVADHFQYHASLAFFALVAAGLTIAGRASLGQYSTIVRVATVAILLVLATLTWQRTRAYHDPEVLYRDTIASNPACSTAYGNLAIYLNAQNRNHESIVLMREAVVLFPHDVGIINNLAASLLAMGNRAGFQPGQLDEIIALCNTALERKPDDIRALNNLGFALASAGRFDEAKRRFARVLELEPDATDALFGMGRVLAASNNGAAAEEFYRRAVAGNPPVAQAHYELAGMLARRGDLRGAKEHFAAAAKMLPTFAIAHNNLGVVLMNLGETDEAIVCFREAARLDAHYAEAQANLGKAIRVKQLANEEKRPDGKAGTPPQ